MRYHMVKDHGRDWGWQEVIQNDQFLAHSLCEAPGQLFILFKLSIPAHYHGEG